MGPRKAQLIFTVALSQWNRRRSRVNDAGSSSSPTSSRNSCGASTSATTARAASTLDPSASRTATARRPRTTTWVTLVPQRTSPPLARSRRVKAPASCPAPPAGAGNPADCPSMHSSQPNRPLPAESGPRSVCRALPPSSAGAPAPVNSSSPSLRTGSSAIRVNRRASPAPRRASRRRPCRTGGKGVNNAPSSGSCRRVQSPYSRRHASPSPAAKASSDAAVSSTSREMTAHEPSVPGSASTSGARHHRSPCCSRCKPAMTGETAASG